MYSADAIVFVVNAATNPILFSSSDLVLNSAKPAATLPALMEKISARAGKSLTNADSSYKMNEYSFS